MIEARDEFEDPEEDIRRIYVLKLFNGLHVSGNLLETLLELIYIFYTLGVELRVVCPGDFQT